MKETNISEELNEALLRLNNTISSEPSDNKSVPNLIDGRSEISTNLSLNNETTGIESNINTKDTQPNSIQSSVKSEILENDTRTNSISPDCFTESSDLSFRSKSIPAVDTPSDGKAGHKRISKLSRSKRSTSIDQNALKSTQSNDISDRIGCTDNSESSVCLPNNIKKPNESRLQDENESKNNPSDSQKSDKPEQIDPVSLSNETDKVATDLNQANNIDGETEASLIPKSEVKETETSLISRSEVAQDKSSDKKGKPEVKKEMMIFYYFYIFCKKITFYVCKN